MNIVRHQKWYSNLVTYIDRVQASPFAYSQFDCAVFAAGAVEAMTGVSLHAEHLGKYKTIAGGLKILKKMGFDNHVEYTASLLPEIHPSMAQLGDIAVIETGDGGYGLGIVQGSRVYVTQPGTKGLGVVDLLRASRAFRVPNVESEGKTNVNP